MASRYFENLSKYVDPTDLNDVPDWDAFALKSFNRTKWDVHMSIAVFGIDEEFYIHKSGDSDIAEIGRHHTLRWTAVPNEPAHWQEVLIEARSDESSNRPFPAIGVVLRGTFEHNEHGLRSGYFAYMDGNGLAIDRVLEGQITNLGRVPFTWSHRRWYMLRARVLGNAIEIKAWQRGEPEPDWALQVRDNLITSGHVGLMHGDVVSDCEFRHVSAGIGASAPGSPVLTWSEHTVYRTDFREYPSNESPGDWTSRYSTDHTVTVRNHAGATGGKVLEITPASAAIRAVTWDKIYRQPTNYGDTPTPRLGHAVAEVDGIIYIHGGYDGRYRNDFWAYNPQTKVFSPRAVGPSPRGYHTAVAIEGKIYLFGGTDDEQQFNEVWRYDPRTNVWSNLGPGPLLPRASHAAAVMNGCMFVFGGTNLIYGQLDDLWMYDPQSNTWTQLASAPLELVGHAMAADESNGYLYVVGGRVGSGHNSSVLRYHASSNTWERMPFAYPSYNGEFSKAFYRDGLLWVIGGNTSFEHDYLIDQSNKGIWTYDPSTNKWVDKGHLELGRHSHGIAVIEDQVYIIFGDKRPISYPTSYRSHGRVNEILRYDLTNDTWHQELGISALDVKARIGVGSDIIVRASGGDGYEYHFRITLSQSDLSVTLVYGGNEYAYANYAHGLGITQQDFAWVRVTMEGQLLWASVWSDQDSEPAVPPIFVAQYYILNGYWIGFGTRGENTALIDVAEITVPFIAPTPERPLKVGEIRFKGPNGKTVVLPLYNVSDPALSSTALRVSDGSGQTRVVDLLDVQHPDASAVRIRAGQNTKAVRKDAS